MGIDAEAEIGSSQRIYIYQTNDLWMSQEDIRSFLTEI
jgi:hypothetical protein